MACFDLKPLLSEVYKNPQKIDEVIEELIARTNTNYILIVGSNDIVPFHEMQIGDEKTKTDDLYGDIDDDVNLIPDIPVGRFSSAGDGQDILINEIDTATDYHSHTLTPKDGSFGLISKEKGPSKGLEEIFSEIGSVEEDLQTSPDTTDYNLDNTLLSRNMLFFALHGHENDGTWHGDKEKTSFPAISFGNVERSDVKGTVIMASVCYGAYADYQELPFTVVGSFLKGNALSFTGFINLAYGMSEPYLDCYEGSDFLALHFFKNLKDRYSVGESVKIAKQDYMKHLKDKESIIQPKNYDKYLSTLHGCVVYGDPSIKPLSSLPPPTPEGGVP